MPSITTFQEELKQRQTIKLRELIDNLPHFCTQFFVGIEPTTSLMTRIAYAYDLNIFFNYLHENVTFFKNKPISDISINDLELIDPSDIEAYLEYLNYYVKENSKSGSLLEYTNGNKGKARKLSSIKSFFRYFYKRKKISKNPASFVDMPKIKEKPIIRLEVDEVANLLDKVESGNELTDTQKRYHKYTKLRDLCILTVFLGTGIRVSELVGINLSDVDFKVNGLKITRKGGNQVVLYFGDEVKKAFLDYLEQRNQITPVPGNEDALFLSLQRKRMSVMSVQNLVKKYAQLVTNLKNISPHKLRSTYGTNLYRETGDIYLVADVLGHKDVNTTKKHYAAIDDDKRRMAARVIKLRDE